MDELVLYYAIGGGLGHLTRARAVLHTLGLEHRAMLVTSSPFGTDPRVVGALPVLTVPSELDGNPPALRLWLEARVAEIRPSEMILDAFPAGILGELDDLPPEWPPLRHVARRLRWSSYAPRLGRRPPRIETSWILEELEPEHGQFLELASERVETLDLIDPPTPALEGVEEDFWLVVHSGPGDEVGQLLLYAAEMQRIEGCNDAILLSSPVEPEPTGIPFRRVDAWPASSWFASAARVITACGFNVMRQMAPWREKHRYLPFPRRLDDQFARAAAARSAGGQDRNEDCTLRWIP